MARTPRIHLWATDQCGLCRLPFPWVAKCSDLDTWQCKFRAGEHNQALYLLGGLPDSPTVFRLYPDDAVDSDGEVIEDGHNGEESKEGLGAEADEDARQFAQTLTFTTASSDSFQLTNVAIYKNLSDWTEVTLDWDRPEIIALVHNRRMCLNQTAFCFHEWCYSILKWKVPHCSKYQIFTLIQSLSPSRAYVTLWQRVTRWHRDWRKRCGLPSPGNSPDLHWLAENFPPSLFPSPIWHLPTELRIQFWEHMGLMTASNAFTCVAKGTSGFVPTLKHPRSRKISLDKGSHLSATMIAIFGAGYIYNLDNGQGSKVIPGEVTQLTFAMDFGGICAIKLLGADWESGWLGQIPNATCVWYGIIRHPGPSVTCIYNGLYCTKILNDRDHQTYQDLWDSPNPPISLADPNASLFDVSRDFFGGWGNFGSDHRASQPRYFSYLSLYNGDDHASGITLYLNGNGTTGLEAHFEGNSQLSGLRSGHPRHFSFGAMERIAYAWLQIGSLDSGPVMLTTTLGRNCSFGPQFRPENVQGIDDFSYRWVRLHGRGCITGLYYEIPSGETPIISQFGITDDGESASRGVQILHHAKCAPPDIRALEPSTKLFLSVAGLRNLKRAEICRVDNRCTGRLLHYFNTPPEVLGQWYTHHLQPECISESGWAGIKNPSRFYFKTFKNRDHQHVSDVSFLPYQIEDGPYHILHVDEHIAWWFSELDDVICHWNGGYVPVPQENLMEQNVREI